MCDFLAWTQTTSSHHQKSPQLLSHYHHHSHLSPAPVPREFPEKQGCQQRQNQTGWELGWLSLSGPLTAHQLTGDGVISLHFPSEFPCLYGFSFPSWNVFWLHYFLEDFFWVEKGLIWSAQVSWNVKVENETGCPLLCFVVTLRVNNFNHHCCIPRIRSFSLFSQSKDYLAYRKLRVFLISLGSRSVSCQFCCGHGTFHSSMLLSVAK